MPRSISLPNLLAPAVVSALLVGSLLSLGAAVAVTPAAADVLHLTNGRTLEGTVTLLDDGRVRLDASYGAVIFSADKVERIEETDSLEATVWAALERLPEEDVEGRLAIAQWVEGYGNHTLARQVRENTVDLAPESPEARATLGQKKIDGEWMTERQFRASRQQVRYGDRWVSEDEARELALRDEELSLARQRQGLLRQQLELERDRLDLAYRTFDSAEDESADAGDVYGGYAGQPLQPYGLPGLDPYGLAPDAVVPQGAGVVPGYLLTRRPFKGPLAPQSPYNAQAPGHPTPQAQRAPGTAPPQQPRLTGPRHNRGGMVPQQSTGSGN